MTAPGRKKKRHRQASGGASDFCRNPARTPAGANSLNRLFGLGGRPSDRLPVPGCTEYLDLTRITSFAEVNVGRSTGGPFARSPVDGCLPGPPSPAQAEPASAETKLHPLRCQCKDSVFRRPVPPQDMDPTSGDPTRDCSAEGPAGAGCGLSAGFASDRREERASTRALPPPSAGRPSAGAMSSPGVRWRSRGCPMLRLGFQSSPPAWRHRKGGGGGPGRRS